MPNKIRNTTIYYHPFFPLSLPSLPQNTEQLCKNRMGTKNNNMENRRKKMKKNKKQKKKRKQNTINRILSFNLAWNKLLFLLFFIAPFFFIFCVVVVKASTTSPLFNLLFMEFATLRYVVQLTP